MTTQALPSHQKSLEVHLTWRQWLALATPPVLVLSMIPTFIGFVAWFGYPLGYLLAFVVYWAGWCLIVAALLLGSWREIPALFRRTEASRQRHSWKTALLLLWPLPFPILFRFLPQLDEANGAILAASVLLGLVIGITEEVLWRGVYVRLFPQHIVLNTLYPSLMFAIWHLAPQAVVANPSPGGAASFVVYSLVLGLSYAIHARKSGSIRGATLSHCIHDIFGLGGFVYAAWLM